MKKLFSFIIFALFILAYPARPAFAVDEAGQAAALAYQQVTNTPDTRITRLQTFLASYNSPLAGEAKTFIAQADKHNLDWKLVAAIAGVESTFGKQIPYGSYNGWGWGIPTGAQSGIGFKNWSEGIATVSEGLRKNYIDRGATNVYEIGAIYAANGTSWGNHVRFFIDKIDSFLPVDPDLLVVSI
jgi:hypothetical protein